MSGASTMRNAVKRITHKERGQPANRKRLGLLEKHKDYVERSYDFHKKDDYIKVLKTKAKERNPDEFYYKMYNSKVSKGVHQSLEADSSIDPDTMKILKTQDLGYIIHKKSVDDKKIEKMKSNLHYIGVNNKSSHKIYVDNQDELIKFDPVVHFETSEELVNNSHNRLKLDQLNSEKKLSGIATLSSNEIKYLKDKNEKSYCELEKRKIRASKLSGAVRALQLQRNLSGKGTKRKIVSKTDPDRAIFKWKRQRSK